MLHTKSLFFHRLTPIHDVKQLTRAPHAVPMLVCWGGHHSTSKFNLKKGHNSKTTAFRVMPLVLQLHFVTMSKYSKFGVDKNI